MRDETGLLRGFSKVTRDATQRKMLQDKLLRYSYAIDVLDNQAPPRFITIRTEVGIGQWGDLEDLEDNSKLPNSQSSIPNPQFVVIWIIDNGQGMAQDVRSRIFDPFFTTKAVGKGTGLGLSISYQIIVQKHGSIFKCISEPGGGAAFAIALPLRRQ